MAPYLMTSLLLLALWSPEDLAESVSQNKAGVYQADGGV